MVQFCMVSRGFAFSLVLVIGVIVSFVTMVVLNAMNIKVMTLDTNIDARRADNICLSAEENIRALLRAQMQLGRLTGESGQCPVQDLFAEAGMELVEIRQVATQPSDANQSGLFPLEPYRNVMSKIEPSTYIFKVVDSDEDSDISCHVEATIMRGTMSVFSTALSVGQAMRLEDLEAPSVSVFGHADLGSNQSIDERIVALSASGNDSDDCDILASPACGNLGMFRIPQYAPTPHFALTSKSDLVVDALTKADGSNTSVTPSTIFSVGPFATDEKAVPKLWRPDDMMGFAEDEDDFESDLQINGRAVLIDSKTARLSLFKDMYFYHPNNGVDKPFLSKERLRDDYPDRLKVNGHQAPGTNMDPKPYWGELSSFDKGLMLALLGQRLPLLDANGSEERGVPVIGFNIDMAITMIDHLMNESDYSGLIRWCDYEYGPGKRPNAHISVNDMLNLAVAVDGFPPGELDLDEGLVCLTPNLEIRRADLTQRITKAVDDLYGKGFGAFLTPEVGFDFDKTKLVEMYKGGVIRAITSLKRFNGWNIKVDAPITISFPSDKTSIQGIVDEMYANVEALQQSPGTIQAPQVAFAPSTWHGAAWIYWPDEFVQRPEITYTNPCGSGRTTDTEINFIVGSKGISSSKQLIRHACKNSDVSAISVFGEAGVSQGQPIAYDVSNLKLHGLKANQHVANSEPSEFVEFSSIPVESPTLVYDDVLSVRRLAAHDPILDKHYVEIPLSQQPAGYDEAITLCNFLENTFSVYDDFALNALSSSILNQWQQPGAANDGTSCGNGIVEPNLGEECEVCASAGCDIYSSGLFGPCDSLCRLRDYCGDGEQILPEECDDGNHQNGDGCSSSCTFEDMEPCNLNGVEDPGEECDDGNNVDSDACSNTCLLNAQLCGDGITNGTEECDGEPSCSNQCVAEDLPEGCGDGVVDGDGVDNIAGNKDDEECDPADEELPTTECTMWCKEKENAFDCAAFADLPQYSLQDCEALVALYEFTNGDSWVGISNPWLEGSYWNWEGVNTSNPPNPNATKRVTAINLSGKNLVGTLPHELESMTELAALNLSENQLSGSIPNVFSGLTSLQTINLSQNELFGYIPDAPPNISILNLSDNQLIGELPASYASKNMEAVKFQHNNLGGELPLGFFVKPPDIVTCNLYDISAPTNGCFTALNYNSTQLAFLEEQCPDWNAGCEAEFDCSDPAVTANIIQSECEALVTLYSALNGANWFDQGGWLSGSDPNEWNGISVSNDGHVTEITLELNNISGELPSEIGDFPELITLGINSTDMSGTLPTELGQLTQLTTLLFTHNTGLSGGLPSSLASLENLSVINIVDNNLSGNLPFTAIQLSGFNTCVLRNIGSEDSNGCFTSPVTPISLIDTCAGWDSGCEQFDCAQAEADGHIFYDECILLTELYTLTNGDDWEDNTGWLTDSDPNNWFGVTIGTGASAMEVESLNLSSNNLIGSINSMDFQNFFSLNTLNLSNNILSGDLPLNIAFMESIASLNLSINAFTGPIKYQYGLLGLENLNLSDNPLTGIPANIDQIGGSTTCSLDSTQCYNDEAPTTEAILWLNDNCPDWKDTNNDDPGTNCAYPVPFVDCATSASKGLIDEGDCDVLIDIYDQILVSNLVGTNWLVTEDPSAWDGVTINGAKNVIGIDLGGTGASSSNPPSGTFPATIAQLGSLQQLNLSNSHMINTLADESFVFPSTLTILSLHENDFTGTIPASIQSLSLAVCSLSGNAWDNNTDSSIWLDTNCPGWNDE